MGDRTSGNFMVQKTVVDSFKRAYNSTAVSSSEYSYTQVLCDLKQG